jgi:uncharacterized protein
MNFTSMINEAIKKAMLARDKDRLEPLRDIKSKLLLESTSGNGEVSEETALKICMKLHKQRIETYDLYIAQNRVDIIQEFLPKMLSEEDIKIEVIAAISQTGASGPQDMGKVMGILSAKLAGKADGKIIASLVKEELLKS